MIILRIIKRIKLNCMAGRYHEKYNHVKQRRQNANGLVNYEMVQMITK